VVRKETEQKTAFFFAKNALGHRQSAYYPEQFGQGETEAPTPDAPPSHHIYKAGGEALFWVSPANILEALR